MYRWIYSYVMLPITSKIFSSLQDRKLGERGENNIHPAKQNLEQEIVYISYRVIERAFMFMKTTCNLNCIKAYQRTQEPYQIWEGMV